MTGIQLQAAANRRQRIANQRKDELIEILNGWGVYNHGNQSLAELNLYEVQNIHINEACRRGRDI